MLDYDSYQSIDKDYFTINDLQLLYNINIKILYRDEDKTIAFSLLKFSVTPIEAMERLIINYL